MKRKIFYSVFVIGLVGCGKNDDSGDSATTYSSFSISTVQTLATPADANPEIIRMIPGTNNKAVYVSAVQKSLTQLTYTADGFTLGSPQFYEQDSQSGMSAITVSPDGKWIVATLIDIEGYDSDNSVCNKGSILIVKSEDLSLTRKMDVGFNPDSAQFSSDGKWLVVVNEDDREDRACKPDSRHGGSVSVIDSSATDPNSWELKQEIEVSHSEDSEPEGVAISSDNDTVIVTIQETSEIGIFKLSLVPSATLTVIDMPTVTDPSGEKAAGLAAEPDGVCIDKDGKYALISNEKNDSFSMFNFADNTFLSTTRITDALPSDYNRDKRKSTKNIEPEECGIVEKSGHLYGLLALQESHAVIVYDITDPKTPTFDSVAKVGNKWTEDQSAGGTKSSLVGTEGLAVHTNNGIVFTANEREGSVTMLKSSWTNDVLASGG
ncbi:MAG: PD40 domain-containing protein [Deltaproteobacteria bacterium]|nr:PD40 domain-containing protein [Deltaproteobacteria bacterium]